MDPVISKKPVTGNRIVIDRNRKIVEGRELLAEIILTGKPLSCFLVVGVEPEGQPTSTFLN